ncbi:MAG: hypothetical protein ACUVXA_06565 [Candidatus Jordarchaeum sp.]|uniref:hypothetical protein n=1 Tax=Candidatus Jordarchaeum sp. TaxID=2823881 RepID=UPI00404B4682
MRNYKDENIRINPSYPLCRFDVSYENCVGSEDDFRIEIGYIRRYPILKSDYEADFFHVGRDESFKVKTPIREELFANNSACVFSELYLEMCMMCTGFLSRILMEKFSGSVVLLKV